MSDLISRQETIKKYCLKKCGCQPKDCSSCSCYDVEIIKAVPTHETPSNTLGALDCVERAEAIKAVKFYETFCDPYPRVIEALEELPSVHLELSNNSPKLDKEIGECNDCIKHGGDWECDRVHCHKQEEPCWVCESLENGDTLYSMSDWDGGIGFDYIRDIEYCPVCGRKL